MNAVISAVSRMSASRPYVADEQAGEREDESGSDDELHPAEPIQPEDAVAVVGSGGGARDRHDPDEAECRIRQSHADLA